MNPVDNIVEKLRAQFESARADLDRARTELDILLGELIGDLHVNLGRYLLDNVKREIRKRPECLRQLDDEKLGQLRADLEKLAQDETHRIVNALRDCPEWYDENTEFLEGRSTVWKTVQSIDPPVNRLIKKYGIAPVKLHNWNWLGDHLNDLASRRFPAAKRIFIEKLKYLSYIESRFTEETDYTTAFERLEEL